MLTDGGILGSLSIFVSVSDTRLDLNLDADVENPGKEKWGWKNGYFCAYLLVIVIFDG